MSVPMIKHNGKMVPAKNVDGKWVPDENAKLVLGENSFEVEKDSVKK